MIKYNEELILMKIIEVLKKVQIEQKVKCLKINIKKDKNTLREKEK